MSVWGKILGGAAGLAVGGPLGALIGAGVGHAVDKQIEASNQRDDGSTDKITFTIGVIALAAKMAKADGEVTGEEIRAFKRLFKVPPEEERNVDRVYNLARQSTAGYEAYAQQIARLFQSRAAILEDLLDALFQIAGADGVFHPAEKAYLEQVASIFGFSAHDIERIEARHIAADKANPYVVLGVASDISNDDLKAHYRKLVRDNHPDRLIADGMPEEFVAVATGRLAAINAAYDRVTAARGMR